MSDNRNMQCPLPLCVSKPIGDILRPCSGFSVDKHKMKGVRYFRCFGAIFGFINPKRKGGMV